MPPLETFRDSEDAMPRILCSSFTHVCVLLNHGLCLLISGGVSRHSGSWELKALVLLKTGVRHWRRDTGVFRME